MFRALYMGYRVRKRLEMFDASIAMCVSSAMSLTSGNGTNKNRGAFPSFSFADAARQMAFSSSSWS